MNMLNILMKFSNENYSVDLIRSIVFTYIRKIRVIKLNSISAVILAEFINYEYDFKKIFLSRQVSLKVNTYRKLDIKTIAFLY
jgi:hypothetical protein